jgi:hypothetical protein
MPRNVFFALLGRIKSTTSPFPRSEKGTPTMNAETKKILELLAAGKISADDAERLIDKMNAPGTAAGGQQESPKPSGQVAPAKPKFLRIVVEKPGQDQVNIRMPIPFARTGTRIMAVLPTQVRERLTDFGVDVASLGTMAESIEDCNIDVDRGNGKRVRIFCE